MLSPWPQGDTTLMGGNILCIEVTNDRGIAMEFRCGVVEGNLGLQKRMVSREKREMLSSLMPASR